MAKDILTRLKFDKRTIVTVCLLVKEHMSRYQHLRSGSVKKLIIRVGKDKIYKLIDLQIADIIGSTPPYDFQAVLELKQEVDRVLANQEPLSVNDLALNGYDLIELGFKPGKKLGDTLQALLEMVLDDPALNQKDKLIESIKLNSE